MVCSTGSCSAAPYPCYAVQSWSISWRVRCKPPSSTTKMRKPPCSSFSRCDFCIICLFGWDFCIICSLRFSRCGFCVICSFRLLRWDFHVLCLLRFSRWDILCVNFELKEMWLLFLLLFIQNKLQGCFQTLGWKQVLFLFPQNMQIWFEKIWFFFSTILSTKSWLKMCFVSVSSGHATLKKSKKKFQPPFLQVLVANMSPLPRTCCK